MIKFLINIPVIIKLILEIVREAEQSIQNGKEKRDHVITLTLAVLKSCGMDLTEYKDSVGLIIDAVVFFYNGLQIFEHHTVPTAQKGK